MGGEAIFNGYFSVDNTTNVIQQFYNANDITFSNNILITNSLYITDVTGTNNNTYTNNIYNSSYPNFPVGGTTITNIPYYNSLNATIWVLWNGSSGRSRLTYYSNGIWNNLSNTTINNFTITPISDPSCFNEGTKIHSLNKNLEEEYIPIENLRKGDFVKSYQHGYKKIDLIGKNHMINNPNRFNECMYKMEKTEENGLIEDLIVTGGHSILVDDLGKHKEQNDLLFGGTQMICDKYLLLSAVSKQFIKLENTNLYTYYHFILKNDGDNDKRYGVWANGILTETPSKNQFTNHKYILL